MRVLGIETSCDETGLALYDGQQGLIGHVLHSQVALHAHYGGVVPELASRDHIRAVLPLLRDLLQSSGVEAATIRGVAYTAGPGLLGALLVGATIGRSLAWTWGIPAIGVHHMEGHLLSPLLEPDAPTFPFLALLVSGGHTLLIEVRAIGQYRLLGESVDDAVGEAFDKTAKLLGLPYPGGPALAQLAEHGDPHRFTFPRPMTDRPGLDFSFSGLKTCAITFWRSTAQTEADRADIARAFEEAVVDTLAIKCQRAMEATGLKTLVVAGGVGANRRLRHHLQHLGKQQGWQVHYPRPLFCTDNGAMIAYVGYQRLQDTRLSALPDRYDLRIQVRARWPLDESPIGIIR